MEPENRRLRVGVLFGGRSFEHEVALQSAKNIIRRLDRNKYEITLIGIDKQGRWQLCDPERYLINADDTKNVVLNKGFEQVALIGQDQTGSLISLTQSASHPVDVVFPVLHGIYGEDGTMQGLLKLAGIPFVGASVIGSSVGMDKDVSKRLLRDAGVPVAKFLTIHRHEMSRYPFKRCVEELGLPLFVKPANAGSSVGVMKIKSQEEWDGALENAFQYDRKILVEECIVGRELECALIGNEHPIISLPGEVIHRHEFYNYEAKYIDGEGTYVEIPAKIDAETLSKVQMACIKAYQVLCCEGMGRVDGFLTASGDFIVSEINTIPGFTDMSPFPHLWEASGVPYTQLLDRLIGYAIDRFKKEQQLKTHYQLCQDPACSLK